MTGTTWCKHVHGTPGALTLVHLHCECMYKVCIVCQYTVHVHTHALQPSASCCPVQSHCYYIEIGVLIVLIVAIIVIVH